MRRRAFIAGLGGAAAWPLVARAQQPTMLVVGFLTSNQSTATPHFTAASREGLAEAGFVEGRNVQSSTVLPSSISNDYQRWP